MSTLYSKLGLDPDASPAEIKRAYRAKAKDVHPDKGGDPAEFASIAHSYEVLKDPQRRLLYDATGQDDRRPIDEEVKNLLLQFFTQILNSEQDIPIVEAVKQSIQKQSAQFPAERKKLLARKKQLQRKRGKISSTGPVNLAHLIIDQHLKSVEAALTNLDHQTEIGKACLAALDTYSEDWSAPKPNATNLQAFTISYTEDLF